MPPLLIASPLAPLILTAPAPSAHGRAGEDHVPRQDEWWKWPTPTRVDALQGAKEWSPRTSKTQKAARVETRIVGAWRVGEAIGSGSSGKVRLARNTNTGEWGAMKRVPKPPRDSKHWAVIEREIILMKLSEHPRVIRLLDVFETPTHLYILSELCEIMVRKPGRSTVRRWFGQLVAALSHLHVLSIAHRDIKPENLLLIRDMDGSMSIKLADLGMATWQKPGTFLDTSCGSPHYASPEVITGVEYDGPPADIWSAGIVLFALVAGRLPFDDDHIPTMMKKIKIGIFSIPPSVDSAAKDLIRKMVVVKPESRISILDVAAHPYLHGVHKNEDDAFTLLPFPLATDSRQAQPPSREEIDQERHLLSNLKILLRTNSDQRAIDAILTEDGASSSRLPDKAWPKPPSNTLDTTKQAMGGSELHTFPPLSPLAPRRQSSAPEPDPRTRTAHLEAPDAEEKPRPKTFSIVKLKERFFGPGQRPSPSTSSPTKTHFTVLRDAPPLPSGISTPPTPSTPTSPATPNPRTVKRSNGYASLAKAAIGLGPSSPSPDPTPDHSPTSSELSSGTLNRKKSSLSSFAMKRRSWIDPRERERTNENAPSASGKPAAAAATAAPPSDSAPSRRHRPAALKLLSSNRLPASDPRSPLPDPTAKAQQQSLSPRPSEDPFSLISVIQPTPTTPNFPQPHSAPLPLQGTTSSGSLRGPAGAPSPRPHQLQQQRHHKAGESVVLKLEADNQLLRAALALKDDEIVSLRNTKHRLSQRVERQAARCDELEEEKDDLAERIKRMSFETSESVDRRWNSLLRDTEEGRSSEDVVAPDLSA
ncbi:hypothetical protein RQP46_004984 [Phenoliferia psychrophenolica]